METTDEFGVYAEYHRNAVVESLVNILWEIVANRKWNPDKSLAKFLFIRYREHFILATNHYRSRESIEKEHTPFKFNNSSKDSNASISARGYGAKLFPFYVEGTYSNLYRITDSNTFSESTDDWGMKDYINITQLGHIIDSNKKNLFVPDSFRSRHWEPIKSKPGKKPEIPFFLEDDFKSTPLYEFIREHNFKYFYIFDDPNSRVNVELENALQELARIYEYADVKIYNSLDLKEPDLIVAKNTFGINPTNWIGSIVLEWRIGEKITHEQTKAVKSYYKSEFRLRFSDSPNVLWGKTESNGSADKKFGMRFASFKPQSEETWNPHVRVIIALTKTEYKSSDDKFQEYIYLRMEDDLISRREADPKISSKIRNTIEPARIRIIMDILEESVKTNPESGLVVSNVKSKSSITPNKALHEIILQSLGLMDKHLSRMENVKLDTAVFYTDDLFKSITTDIHKDKAANERKTKRKAEGLIFESTVSKYLTSKLGSVDIDGVSYTITWEANDSTISADHGLEGLQGIDTLGKLTMDDKILWIAVQSKDRESGVPNKELDTFKNTVDKLRQKKQEINGKDKVLSVLSLAKKKSFNYEVYEKMLSAGIITVIETDGTNTEEPPTGSKTVMAIKSLLDIVN